MEAKNISLTLSEDFALNVTPYVTLSYGLLPEATSESTSADSDLNMAKAAPMTIVYALIFITGIFGNFCTCAVIARNKHMHTATNFYLFSLAMSDLLLLVLGLPQEMFQLWVPLPYLFGETFCVIRGLAAETSTNASILTITSFTMERYLAICHPLRAHTMSKLSRAVKLIVLIWVVAAVCAVPQAIQFGLVPRNTALGDPIPHTEDCSLKMPLQNAFELSTLFFFLLPMSLITVLYILIGVRLRDHVFRVASSREAGSGSFRFCSSDGAKQRKCVDSSGDHNRNGMVVMVLSTSEQPLVPGPQMTQKHKRSLRQESCEQRRHHSTNSRRAVVKMLVAVVVAFFVCWAPFHAQRLMAIYAPNQDPYDVIYEALTYVSGVLYYVSATVNPILYHIMSHKFRSAFKDTLGGCCKRTRARRRSSSLNNYHKNNSVYNYHSTVRSRVGTENTETTLETLLRDELECPGTGVTGTTTASPGESNGDKSALNGKSAAKSRTNHRHHHRKTANGSSKSASNLYKNNLISKSGSSSFSSSSVSSSLNSESNNKNSVGVPPPPLLEVTLPIVDGDDSVNKDELVIEMEEFLKMNPSIPIKNDGGNGNYVSRC